MHRGNCRLLVGLVLALLSLTAEPGRGAEAAPNCYYLAVGIDAYPETPLNGCVNDATAAAQQLSAQAGKRFRAVAGTTLLDQQATAAAVRQGLQQLQQAGQAGDF